MNDRVFENDLAEFVYMRTYSRWSDDKKRRETWEETVDRAVTFLKKISKNKLKKSDYALIQQYIYEMKVMPSMRLMWTAGKPAELNNAAIYNCSTVPIDALHSLAEIYFLLMSGAGVGVDVSRRYVEKIPKVKKLNGETKTVVFDDSKEGWSAGTLECCQAMWDGFDVEWNLSKLRPQGARLKTFGGRSSGPGPLDETLHFIKHMIENHRERKLSSVNMFDIVTKIAASVVVGGGRRSSIITLSDLYDRGMRDSKKGQFWITNSHRAMSNNSAIYDQKPTSVDFMKEWLTLAESGTGERGIFNRSSINSLIPKRRRKRQDWTTNPCGEIILRPRGLCNLSEVVIRADDTLETLMEKVKVATMIGTIQSGLTNFKFLNDLHPDWEKNATEERLLGVSLTGQMDNPEILTEDNLQSLRDYAIGVNVETAGRLNINRSAAITTTKPSGTASLLVNSASGFHPRFSDYYIRRVRISTTDPLYKMLKDQGLHFQPEVGQPEDTAQTWVCEFPVKAPDHSVKVNDVTAIEQLQQWLKIKHNYTEHTVSATIYVTPDEWFKVGNFVYENFDDLVGVSFLPKDDHIYQLAPYEEIDEKTYNKMVKKFPAIDYSKLSKYEKEDNTTGAQTVACSGDSCEII
ncbi:MAG: ribonucleoside-triphosphate reductase [Candidatus Marinimicrobia bacterium]|nr:ribonucleoside-triphosphate reductase [Candidatus Neomarinimicrobiota bacterium]